MEYDPESDLRALEAMAANLTPYVYEEALFGTLSPNLPKLTVGALLLRLYRLKGLEDQLDPDQQNRLHDAQMNFERLRSEWITHYEAKIEQEIQSRLRTFKAFLNDYADNNALVREGYPAEAIHRTMLYHLSEEARHLEIWTDDFEDELDRQDGRLRAILAAGGEFLWAETLESLYPKSTFWWLYGYPQD